MITITPSMRPAYVLLPKPGERCRYTSLSRPEMLALVKPMECNRFKPPCKAIFQRSDSGTITRIRVNVDSVLEWLRQQENNHHLSDG